MSIDRITSAMTNFIFCISYSAREKYLLRIYGDEGDSFIDRALEMEYLSWLGEKRLSPKLLGSFSNGRIEEYVESRTLTHNDIRNPNFSARIASEMHRLHDHMQACSIKSNIGVIEKMIYFYDSLKFDEALSSLPFCTLTLINKMNERMKQYPLQFCHNDLQYGNIIVRPDNSIMFLDYEYGGYGVSLYDIANHFCEWMASYEEGSFVLDASKFPSKKEQIHFLNNYFVEPFDAESILAQIDYFVHVSHLFWGLWGLYQAKHCKINFDYHKYAMQRLSLFKWE